MIDGFERLPCGGSITTFHDQTLRVVRRLDDNHRQATFILLHPPRLKAGEGDMELALAERFCTSRQIGNLVVLYLFPFPARQIKELQKVPVPWGPGPDNRRIQEAEILRTPKPERGGYVIAAWGDDGNFKDVARLFVRRFDGTPGGFSWQRQRVTPFFCMGLTGAGNPIRLRDASLTAEPQLLFPISEAA